MHFHIYGICSLCKNVIWFDDNQVASIHNVSTIKDNHG